MSSRKRGMQKMPKAQPIESIETVASGAFSPLSRRRVLLGLGGSSALIGLSGCGGLSLTGDTELPPENAVGQAVLLAPLTGPRASLGQIMLAAASLGGNATGPGAEVEVVGQDRLRISHPEASAPTAARYAWQDNPVRANLVSSHGLPAAPFKTD